MYMCGRLRTASRPSRTLMLSAEYSPLAAAPVAGCLSCEISKITPRIGCRKYHARSPGSKAKRRLYLSENRLFFGRDPACGDALEERVFCRTFRDQIAVGRGEHDLAGKLRQIRHEKCVSLRIELARDVVEQEQRRAALLFPQVFDLADPEGEHHRARLALAGVEAGRLVADEDAEVVRMRPDAGETALAVALQSIHERLAERLLAQVLDGRAQPQIGLAPCNFGERSLRVRQQLGEDFGSP